MRASASLVFVLPPSTRAPAFESASSLPIMISWHMSGQ